MPAGGSPAPFTEGIGESEANLDDGGGTTERERGDIVKLGARLANAEDFRVVTLDGRDIGLLENVRYEKHTDHPDDFLVRRRVFLWDRYATVGFEQVANVDPERGRVYLTVPSGAIEWKRSVG